MENSSFHALKNLNIRNYVVYAILCRGERERQASSVGNNEMQIWNIFTSYLRIEYGCIFLFSKDLGVSILDILGVYFVYLLHLTQIEPVKLAGDANVSIFHQTA